MVECVDAVDGDWLPSTIESGCIGGVGGNVIRGLLTVAGPKACVDCACSGRTSGWWGWRSCCSCLSWGDGCCWDFGLCPAVSAFPFSPSATLNNIEIEGSDGFCSSTGGEGGD